MTTWFEIMVENSAGIRGKHYVQSMYPSSAVEAEQDAGFIVLAIREWSTKRFPNLGMMRF